MKIGFEGQTVLVTGATRGIGQKIAEDFLDLGAELILTGKDSSQVERLNEESATLGLKKKYYAVDFTREDSVLGFIEEIGKVRKLDVCVNNAGINRINFIEETRLEDWDDITAVNLKAPFLITRAVAGVMKENRYGRIVNISSVFGVVSREKRSIYSTTKFGLRGLTVAVSNELARYNVLVNAVSPGFVLTELTKTILREHEIKELESQIPARRLGTTGDISGVVLFLSSRQNTYVTGQNIIVDGGFVNV